MSTLIRDPLRPDGPPIRVAGHEASWPADPGQTPRPTPVGAEWDPLCQPWPALMPAQPVPGPVATRPAPAMTGPARADDPAPDRRAPAPAIPKLVLPPEPRPARDVSPSRLAYRLNRLWLTPAVRRFICHGLPVLLLVGGLAAFWSGDQRRAMVIGAFADMRAAIEARPEFRIDRIEVLTDTPEVAQAVLSRLEVDLPASSLRLDLADLRARTEALDAVARAAVQVRAGGVLEVRVTERLPAMVWRDEVGLSLVDADGRRVALIADRSLRPELPLIAGTGAPAAIAEARRLFEAAEPIRHRLIGLVRVGERRWDVVLDRGQRIQLPAEGAVPTLERVLALDAAQDLLARDLSRVDMRNPLRPTIQLTPGASTELARLRQQDIRMANR